MSGCAFPGGNEGTAFDAVDAPVWESGYSWTYEIVSSSQSSGFGAHGMGSDGDSGRGKVTMRVINTTKEVDGEPVYVVSMGEGGGQFDHPIFSGDLQAMSKSALETLAIGFQNEYYGHEMNDACMGTSPLYRTDAHQQFPALRFPLDDGATWSGSLGFMDPVSMEYVITAHGLVDVEVPAGSFKAVYITTEFKPGDVAQVTGDEVGMIDFDIRSEQWYSPDVRYLVKHILTVSASVREEQEQYQFAYRTGAVLQDFSLETAPEEPAPEVVDQQDNVAHPYYPTRIVSDTVFPVNVADGPVTARLTLEQAGGRGNIYEPQISTVDELKPLSYDNETHEIAWTVSSYNDGYGNEEKYTGEILDLVLERGGEYQIRAAIQPKKCGANMLGDAYGTASAYWSKTFTFGTSTGDLPGTIAVGEIPVEGNAYEGFVSWVREPKVGYSPDQANVLLRGPDGRTQSFPTNQIGESSFAAYPQGTYELSWQTTGLPSAGEDIELTVTVNYSYVWH